MTPDERVFAAQLIAIRAAQELASDALAEQLHRAGLSSQAFHSTINPN
jgi:hypothetical protein